MGCLAGAFGCRVVCPVGVLLLGGFGYFECFVWCVCFDSVLWVVLRVLGFGVDFPFIYAGVLWL